MFSRLFHRGRRARLAWEAELDWFRLRYHAPAGPSRCIALLSRPEACGRVALYYRPETAVSRLYLGLPRAYARLIRQMAADFAFSLHPETPLALPPPAPLRPAGALPWDRPFLAHVVNGALFFSQVGEEENGGAYFPTVSAGGEGEAVGWMLPPDPPLGMTTRPAWNGAPPPSSLISAEPDADRWPLGRTGDGRPLSAAGRVNVYGREEAVVDWLTCQVTRLVSDDPANLVVIDGAGDLAPRLKRKAAVTRLLGKGLTYIDLDSAALVEGLNLLAPAPGETSEETVGRWQRWAGSMGVHPQGVALLADAYRDGVEDLAGLGTWLKRQERAGGGTAVSSLKMALNRLTRDRLLRQWLSWPNNCFAALPEGALFFACRHSGWDRRQVLRAVLLAVQGVPGVRLILHGFPWERVEEDALREPSHLLMSNGPLLPAGTVVLTASRAGGVAALAGRFLGNDARLGEKLSLLGQGESLILADGDVTFAAWGMPPQ